MSEITYLAGIFDGEGHAVRDANNGQVRVGVAQTTVDVVYRFKALFGGSVRWEQRRKGGIYRWQTSGPIAIAALEQLGPWLRIKEARVNLLIRYHKFRSQMGRNKYDPRRAAWRRAWPTNRDLLLARARRVSV